jgi:phospholipase C
MEGRQAETVPVMPPPARAGMSRRRFLGAATATAGAICLGRALPAESARARFDHVVVVMMENRSFDHLLGWLPGADGRQAGLTFLDAAGAPHATHPLAPDFQGCANADPDHSYEGGRVEFNGGACDGWMRAGANDDYAVGYHDQGDLPFLGQAAPQWTVCARYFAPIMAETYPNRIYLHAGQTDRIRNTRAVCRLPTIWDRLAAARVSGRYYFSDIPFLALWGRRFAHIGRPVAGFYADCARGTLPAVSVVDPKFMDAARGTSGDDHPHGDIRRGDAFMARIYRAVTAGPAWPRTVLIFTFDEWGGFFDHVAPPTAPIPPATAAAGDQDGRLGFRVPCLIVSPFARRGHIATNVYDHTSILRMIESRWGLPALTIRDRTANDLGLELVAQPQTTAPRLSIAAPPAPTACAPATGPTSTETWTGLRALARLTGWHV